MQLRKACQGGTGDVAEGEAQLKGTELKAQILAYSILKHCILRCSIKRKIEEIEKKIERTSKDHLITQLNCFL
jgi:hypothetical protein